MATGTQQDKAVECLKGVLSRIFFSDGGYLIGRLDTGESIVGDMLEPNLGQEYEFWGDWGNHPQYGRQFKFRRYVTVLPKSTDGIIRYLVRIAKWVKTARAKIIVDLYGEDTLQILKEDPERVAREVKGITLARAKDVQEFLKQNEALEAATVEIEGIIGKVRGLPKRLPTDLLKEFGSDAPTVVRNDPYVLTNFHGVGFKLADSVAMLNDYPPDGILRKKAAIKHVLAEAAKMDGHTCLTIRRTLDDSQALINCQTDEGMAKLAEEQEVFYLGSDYVALAHIHHDEKSIAGIARSILEKPLRESITVPSDDLAPDQIRAATLLCSQRMGLLLGPPGSGKTYLFARIVKGMRQAGLRNILFCAPTGKAATRMTESLQELIPGAQARTIHKTLGPQMDFDSGTFTFRHGTGVPLECDALIVDECFDYRQPILTEKGWKCIGTVVESKSPLRVWSRNPASKKLELKHITGWLKKPRPKEMLRISAGRSHSRRNARLIRCTPEHKILTPTGYKIAKKLRPGDPVVVRGTSLSPEQRNVIIGSILGDGHLTPETKRRSPQMSFVQGEDQLDYLQFKKNMFGDLASLIRKYASGYNPDRSIFTFSLKVADELWEIRDGMKLAGYRPNGRSYWSPNDQFLSLINEQVLAIWYLDNGHTAKRATKKGISYDAKLHTERFTRKDNDRIAKYLKSRFCIKASVRSDSREFWFLSFSTKETEKLFDIIKPYTPACMAYKVPDGCYQTPMPDHCDTVACPIQSIKTEASRKGYPNVYDIEVEDFHNYVAGNVVVSNCSMLDTHLAARLLEACTPDMIVLFIGDPDQLPSIGPGSVLKDLSKAGVPTAELNEIKRNAGQIVQACHAIRLGRPIQWSPKVDLENGCNLRHINKRSGKDIIDAIVQIACTKVADFGFDPFWDFQVVAPMNERSEVSCKALNEALSDALNPGVNIRGFDFRVGDKIVRTRNEVVKGGYGTKIDPGFFEASADEMGAVEVVNGDVGKVIAIERNSKKKWIIVARLGNPDRVVYLARDSHFLQRAYCMTTHKMQGSDAPIVAIPLHRSFGSFPDRSWIYTSISRAKYLCLTVGDQGVAQNMIRRLSTDRTTKLVERFQGKV